jgi:predicted amidophosphoribosyltransferase
MVAQKTLNKLQDRIDNAQQTIIVEDKTPFDNILLIDDAVGSGATLNETAAQIKRKKLCKGRIIGLAIVGSFKGFDIISEV